MFINLRQKMSVTLELGTKAENSFSNTGVAEIYRGLVSGSSKNFQKWSKENHKRTLLI